MARRGVGWQGDAGMAGKARRGGARPGAARRGVARQARYGVARCDVAYLDLVRQAGVSVAQKGRSAMKKTRRWQDEIRRISKAHGGVLKAVHVVQAARPVKSPLHPYFEWDNGKAAEAYRLIQAGRMIRVVVTILPQAPTSSVRALVSLQEDRSKPGGGYRIITDVMSDENLRAQLLREALSDARVLIRKYQTLAEVATEFGTVAERLEELVIAAEDAACQRALDAETPKKTRGRRTA